MHSNQLKKNAIMAIAQTVISGVVLFVIYGYLLRTIGAEQLGIWSLVLATASVSKISEFGFTGSAVKFTAKYIALHGNIKAAEVVQTTVITIAIVLGIILVMGYPLIALIMEKVVPVESVQDSLLILPYALVSVWVAGVAGGFLSALDGCQRIDLRAAVTILASIVLLVLTWILAPIYGLSGLAWAQIGQGITLLICARVFLRKALPELQVFSFKWSYSLFREMLQYGANFQIISIVRMFFDPTTKVLLASFGGLADVAYYEMASRMVTQFRSLIVSANQVMVPRIAALHENDPKEISKTYIETYNLVYFMALPLYACIIMFLPVISELWIGHYVDVFVWFSLLLVAGYWLNTLIGPAYFVYMGVGTLRWNVLSHVAIGVLNIILGYMLGMILGSVGVVLGYTLALVVGSSLVVVKYHFQHDISLVELLPSESIALTITCGIGLLSGWYVFYFLQDDFLQYAKYGLIFTTCIIMAPAFWLHPVVKKQVYDLRQRSLSN